MPVEAAVDRHKAGSARPLGAARLLLLCGGLFLVMAGGLLWSRHGAAVFSDYALAALAWCF